MVDFLISAGAILAKGLAIGAMVITCAAICFVELHRAEESTL